MHGLSARTSAQSMAVATSAATWAQVEPRIFAGAKIPPVEKEVAR